ncbi:hypothetical protein [Shewanella sp. WPAGA9]|uniref:hypothetical protein n=1 Tax=Shewanella sp. ENK2 TaxID=2775245 RepID=UPI00178659DE|nr:hypothetical protein [Shewanella sp. WPAGA9]
MKKSVLALSVISALFLAGCSSDDDSSSPEPVESARNVTVDVRSIYGELSTTPMSINSEEDIGPIADCNLAISKTSPSDESGSVPFDLQYCNDGYTLTIVHEGGTIIKEDVTLDQTHVVGNVTGEVTFTVTHPELDGVTDAHYYTLSGTATIDASEIKVDLITKNEDWSLVTVSDNSDISATRLNNLNMISHDSILINKVTRSDYVMYTKELESFLEVESNKHSNFGSTYIETLTDTHSHLTLTINEEGSVIVDPGFEADPINVIPSEPVINLDRVHKAEVKQVDMISGAVTLKPMDSEGNKNNEAKVNNGGHNGVALENMNMEFSWSAEIEDAYHNPYVSVYVSGKYPDNDEGKAVKNISIYGNNKETVTIHFEDETQLSNVNISELGHLVTSTFADWGHIGNYYIRLNDDNYNNGVAITVTEYNFSEIVPAL